MYSISISIMEILMAVKTEQICSMIANHKRLYYANAKLACVPFTEIVSHARTIPVHELFEQFFYKRLICSYPKKSIPCFIYLRAKTQLFLSKSVSNRSSDQNCPTPNIHTNLTV